MKAIRLVFALVALVVAGACSADVTGPSSSTAAYTDGVLGSPTGNQNGNP